MKTTVTESSFRDAFRAIRPDNFSHEGLGVLFAYLEEIEEDCGTEHELDVIGLCCDYMEQSIDEIADDYTIDLTDYADEDEKRERVREYLEENTSVCGPTEAGFVYQQF